MPELPEVETVRRSLEPYLVGQRVVRVLVRRVGVITGPHEPDHLLRGSRIDRLDRRGKEILILSTPVDNSHVADTNPCISVHLGMTGSLRYYPSSLAPTARKAKHAHLAWELESGGWMIFHDPRRFGGVWTFPTPQAHHQARWSRLGPDALTITPKELAIALAFTRRPIKAALLDQSTLAGLGNIYVDELLFACGIHPTSPARLLREPAITQLVRQMRQLLQRALKSGGSTLRDYASGLGDPGKFQFSHKVYGCGGKPCAVCKTVLRSLQVAGRTTVFCPLCQPTGGIGEQENL